MYSLHKTKNPEWEIKKLHICYYDLFTKVKKVKKKKSNQLTKDDHATAEVPASEPSFAALEQPKLVTASGPISWTAALSYAKAASSAVSNVPSHTRTGRPSRALPHLISAAHFPHGLCLTPRNFLFFFSSLAGILILNRVFPPRSRLLLTEESVGSMTISLTHLFPRRRGGGGDSVFGCSSSSLLEESVASASVNDILTILFIVTPSKLGFNGVN